VGLVKTLCGDSKPQINLVRRILQPNHNGATFRRNVVMTKRPSDDGDIAILVRINLESRSADMRTDRPNKERPCVRSRSNCRLTGSFSRLFIC
jgi:hypothetical protein